MSNRPAQHCSRCEKSRKRVKVLEKRLSTQMATISQQYAELRGYRLNVIQYEAAVKANAEAELQANSGLQGEDSSIETQHDPVPAHTAVDVCRGQDDGDSRHSAGENG